MPIVAKTAKTAVIAKKIIGAGAGISAISGESMETDLAKILQKPIIVAAKLVGKS